MFLLCRLLWATSPFDEQRVYDAARSPWRSQRIHNINPDIPQEAYQKAARGTVATGIQKIDGHEAKMAWGVGIIALPIEHLYASINEEENHTEHTAVSYTKIISGKACENERLVMMILPLPLVSDRWWVTKQYTNPKLRESTKKQAAELAWQEIEAPILTEKQHQKVSGLVQVPFTRGSWFLIALDPNHTLAEYHSWVDPGGSLPAGPASDFATGSIKDTFTQMENYARAQKTSMCRPSW